jgi:HEAT repeat protein
MAVVVALIALLPCLVASIPLQAQEDDLLESWRETLLYGIDSEVESILPRIAQAGENSLDEQIVDRFAATRSNGLRVAILEHFTELESPVLGDEVRTLILSDGLLNDDLLRESAAYLSRIVEESDPELLDRYADIAEDGNVLAASVAIDAIGRDGGTEAVALLLDLYGRLNSTDLRGAIIRALGETGDLEAVPLLTGIASDEFEESSLRQYAAESLGRIGAPESLELLTSLLAEDDSLLRAYATYALGFYDTDEAADLLESALRDSFWRVRVAALDALGEQGRAQALPAVAYKARRDPEQPVRRAALAALGRIGGERGLEELRELALDDRVTEDERMIALEQLAAHPGEATVELFQKIVAEEWEREGSRLLDAVGRLVSENPATQFSPVYRTLFEHPNFIVRIYAMRGSGRAGVRDLVEEMKRVARENPPGLLRRSALAALDNLGITYDPEADADPDEAQADGEGAGDGENAAADDAPRTDVEETAP